MSFYHFNLFKKNSYGYLCSIYSTYLYGDMMRYSIEIQGYGIIGVNGNSGIVSPVDAVVALLILEACVDNGICWYIGNRSYEYDFNDIEFIEEARKKAVLAVGKHLVSKYMYRRVLSVEKT